MNNGNANKTRHITTNSTIYSRANGTESVYQLRDPDQGDSSVSSENLWESAFLHLLPGDCKWHLSPGAAGRSG